MNNAIALLFAAGFIYTVVEVFRFIYGVVVKKAAIRWNFRFIMQCALILFAAQVPVMALNAFYPRLLMLFWLVLYPGGIALIYWVAMKKLDRWGIGLVLMPLTLGVLLATVRAHSMSFPGSPMEDKPNA